MTASGSAAVAAVCFRIRFKEEGESFTERHWLMHVVRWSPQQTAAPGHVGWTIDELPQLVAGNQCAALCRIEVLKALHHTMGLRAEWATVLQVPVRLADAKPLLY